MKNEVELQNTTVVVISTYAEALPHTPEQFAEWLMQVSATIPEEHRKHAVLTFSNQDEQIDIDVTYERLETPDERDQRLARDQAEHERQIEANRRAVERLRSARDLLQRQKPSPQV